MNYSKFYYSLLNLKKVVISTYFNITIYIEFELFNYLLVYLSNYIFSIKIFCFPGKFAYLLFICTRKFFFASLQLNHCC
jgi:hypothetical protein